MVEGRGGSFSLEPQLAALFDSDRAGELHGKLRKLLQKTKEGGKWIFPKIYSFFWVVRESQTLNELQGLHEYVLSAPGI